MVALTSSNSVLEAARATESGNIGAVIVQNKERIAGIVTDRDLAIRVLGRRLDPAVTMLRDVMTTPVATMVSEASHTDAIRLMQQRNIRRIPLVEDGLVVGIVTLDDLLLDEATPLDDVATVIEAQIGAGGRQAASGSPTSRRIGAHSLETRGHDPSAHLDDRSSTDRRETALETVLGSIFGA